jgi:hypothetical protein
LGPAVTPSLTAQSAPSDLYEGYLFTLILDAARTEGAQVTLRAVGGGFPNPFVFRTSPGYLNSSRHNYGYAEIAFHQRPVLEAHVGVRVTGHSNVLHECDVSVIDQAEAALCRGATDRLAPRSARVLIAVEAKYYTTDLPLHFGRAFLGLVRDFSADSAFFIFNGEAESVERLLAHKKQQWENHIEPTNVVPVSRLKNAFQTTFKNFRARTRP